MPAWSRVTSASRLVNIFPRTRASRRRALHAHTYNSGSACTGDAAQVDGDLVTVFRTAGAAASGCLIPGARGCAVLLPTGRAASPGLRRRPRTVQPIDKVWVWNARPPLRAGWRCASRFRCQ